MALDRMPKGANIKQLDWINIWKPNVNKGETERAIEVVVYDVPRYIKVHTKFVRTSVYDSKAGKYVLRPQMHYLRCNEDEQGYCAACMQKEYLKIMLAVPVLEISKYINKDGEKKTFIFQKILGLGTAASVKIQLESSDGLGTDYTEWVGVKLKLTRVGQKGQATGDMVKILNPENGKLPRGQKMLDTILALNPNLNLKPVDTADFDPVAMRCMNNENLGKFLDQLNGANVKNGEQPQNNNNTPNGNGSPNDEILEDDEIPF